MDQVLNTIAQFGGLPWLGKVAFLIAMVVASMKVSFFNELIWNKFDGFKVWVAPILGLIAGVTEPLISGAQLSVASVFAYITAGAGAVFMHEILDSIKAIPGLGSMWVNLIKVIEGALGGPKSG